MNLHEDKVREAFALERLKRAIGVIYAPESERVSHYFDAKMSDQFDAVAHYDRTHAVEPLDRHAVPDLAPPSDLRY